MFTKVGIYIFVLLYVLQFIGLSRVYTLLNTSEPSMMSLKKGESGTSSDGILTDIRDQISDQLELYNTRLSECKAAGISEEECLNDVELQQLKYISLLRDKNADIGGSAVCGIVTSIDTEKQLEEEGLIDLLPTESFTIRTENECEEGYVCLDDEEGMGKKCYTGYYDITQEITDEQIQQSLLYEKMSQDKTDKPDSLDLENTFTLQNNICVPSSLDYTIRNTRMYILCMTFAQIMICIYSARAVYLKQNLYWNILSIIVSFMMILFSLQIFFLLNDRSEYVKLSQTKPINEMTDDMNSFVDTYHCMNIKEELSSWRNYVYGGIILTILQVFVVLFIGMGLIKSTITPNELLNEYLVQPEEEESKKLLTDIVTSLEKYFKK